MLGMNGLNDIFRGKVRGLPTLNENDQASRVTDNIMSRKLGLKEKGDALKLKFKTNNIEGQLFNNFKMKTAPNFAQYLRVNNKQSQESKVWQMIRPRTLNRDRFSFNEVISPGNEDIVPDTQDARAWSEQIGYNEEQQQQTEQEQYDPNVFETLHPTLQKGAKEVGSFVGGVLKKGYKKGVEKYEEYKNEKDREKAGARLTKIRQREARLQVATNPELLTQIELQRLQQNAQLKYELKRKELGLLPTRSTTGKGKNRKEVVSYEGGYTGQVVSQPGGPFSSMLPRTAQADWRQYFSQNMPGSPAGIGTAVGGRALANREENILQMTRTTGNPMNVLQATGRTGGSTGQILSTIQSGNVNAFPGNLSGTDKIRWIIASPAQREQMLQLLQSQPVQQQQVSYEQPTQQAPVREVSAQPGKLIYSPQSKKPVAYTRGTYNKNRQ